MSPAISRLLLRGALALFPEALGVALVQVRLGHMAGEELVDVIWIKRVDLLWRPVVPDRELHLDVKVADGPPTLALQPGAVCLPQPLGAVDFGFGLFFVGFWRAIASITASP